jgi:hypothetical protein
MAEQNAASAVVANAAVPDVAVHQNSNDSQVLYPC